MYLGHPNYGDFMKHVSSEQGSSKAHQINGLIQNSVTPMIIEERPLNVSLLSVFDRLMMDRIIYIYGPVRDAMAITVQAQLMYLDSINESPITFNIMSPGGSVYAGLAMIDVMNYIKSDITTINVGMCASMASVLLGCGTKGKRHALPSSTTMIHQSSGGAGGNIQDAEISMKEWKKLNEKLIGILAERSGQTAAKLKKDMNRDYWMDATETQAYGLVDSIITKRS